MTKDDQDRAAFEAAYAKEFPFSASVPGWFKRNVAGDYYVESCNTGFAMWQAATAEERERCAEGCHACGPSHYECALRKIERLRADAARYQWLRNQHWTDNTLCAVSRPKEAIRLGHDAPAGDRLDELIDAAMKETP